MRTAIALLPLFFPIADLPSSPSSAAVTGWPVRAPIPSGSYVVFGTVSTSGSTYAHPDVQGSEDWKVRDVQLNGARLTENVDYTVIDDGSNKGMVMFDVALLRGDQVQISGPTLEPGPHGGGIWFE
jgi:hypothetical protein